MMKEIKLYREQGMTEEELRFMQNAFTLSDALEYETPNSKVAFLRQLLAYDLADDYRETQTSLIRNMTTDRLNAVAQRELNLDEMQIIVVGDAEALAPQLATLDLPVVPLSLN